MKKNFKHFALIVLLSLVPTLLIWAPFFFRFKSFWTIPLPQAGMATIVANYDGPLFLVVAKTFYSIEAIKGSFTFPLPAQYYAAHFPLFPLLIKIFGAVTNFPYAMLAVTLLSSILALYYFNKFSQKYVGKSKAIWLTAVFALLPARWLIVRSVGSAEPLFIASIIASIYYFRDKKYLAAGLWGAAAQLTKSPAILLFIAYFFSIAAPKFKLFATQSFGRWVKSLELRKTYPIFFIPASLLILFIFYGIRFNDFLAYFHSGDNIHLFFPPFQIFNYSQPWVGTFWLEEVIFVYLLAILGILKLIKQGRYYLAWFVGIFFFTVLFVSHRDIIRYSLPMVPFLLVAFSDTITKKEFRIVMAVILIPIYLFSVAYISQNVMPISDWAPLL